MKASKKTAAPQVIDADDVPLPFHEAGLLKAALSALEILLVGRDNEIQALTYCLATGHHLMLEGEPGVAKSMFAREAFKRIESAKVFSRQFMKGTQLDEIFGPMNSEKYRKDAVWEYNTKGMLPDCELAFLDEVYRGSDSALPSMLQILNERTFNNGTVLMKCPLHTAVGTTNFTTDTEELRAFHDRWLVRMKVKPLENTSFKVRMLRQFTTPPSVGEDTIRLDSLRTLSAAVPKVPIEDEMLELYVQTVDTYRKSLQNRPVSERRLCHSLSLVQAEALLSRSPQVKAEHLQAAKYGLTTFGVNEQTEAFDQAFGVVVGAYIQESEERNMLKGVESYCDRLVSAYDDSLSSKAKKNLMTKCLEALEGMNNFSPEETPKTRAGLDRVAEIRRRLTEVAETLRMDLGGVST